MRTWFGRGMVEGKFGEKELIDEVRVTDEGVKCMERGVTEGILVGEGRVRGWSLIEGKESGC